MQNAPRPSYPDQDDDKYIMLHANYNRLSTFRRVIRSFGSSDALREVGFDRTSIREAPLSSFELPLYKFQLALMCSKCRSCENGLVEMEVPAIGATVYRDP